MNLCDDNVKNILTMFTLGFGPSATGHQRTGRSLPCGAPGKDKGFRERQLRSKQLESHLRKVRRLHDIQLERFSGSKSNRIEMYIYILIPKIITDAKNEVETFLMISVEKRPLQILLISNSAFAKY